MLKNITNKDLPLFSIIDIQQFCHENHLEDTLLTDFCVGWNSAFPIMFGRWHSKLYSQK